MLNTEWHQGLKYAESSGGLKRIKCDLSISSRQLKQEKIMQFKFDVLR